MIGFHPATAPRPSTDVRLLCVDRASGRLDDRRLESLAEQLRSGDLLVLNDAATLPASFLAEGPGGARIEVRLAEPIDSDGRVQAVLFGSGTWRDKTEDRPPPPVLAVGARLTMGTEVAEIVGVSTLSPRLVRLAFLGTREGALAMLYARGRPVQYAYLADELALWDVQTAYAARPWAVEAPSAGLGLTWSMLEMLERRGVELATVTHAAGLSSTGDDAIDRALPLAERSDVPQETIDAIARTHRRGGRVIAVGTSVVRALEGRAAVAMKAGADVTELRLGPSSRLRIVDGILTGMHAPGESHHQLLGAFADAQLLERAVQHAAEGAYLAHELGDTMLIL